MLFYRLNQRVNPRSPEEPRKYYAFPKASGTAELRDLANRISRESTVSSMDTLAVLEGLLHVIPDFLLEGKIVRLGDFGTFRLGLSSEGIENPDEFNASMIKRTNLLFRPGIEFRDQLTNVKFTRVSDASVSS
ncbi:MAG: HU family DNA-binding protein [Bacteroidales bacterium]|nr:HU family DNA-binding protein [Bacteroidales bacterium]